MCATRATAWPPHAPNRPGQTTPGDDDRRQTAPSDDDRHANNRRQTALGDDYLYPDEAAAPTFPATMTATRITPARMTPPELTLPPRHSRQQCRYPDNAARMITAAPDIPGIDATARMTPPG